MEMETEDKIRKRVHHLYWELDMNCARTVLTCLAELFQVNIQPQTMNSALGLHGAGGYRAQCGLVEGALMFLGIYLTDQGSTEAETIKSCYQFAEYFTKQYGTLSCFDLRPNGFTENDPPHACEELTVKGICSIYQFIAALNPS